MKLTPKSANLLFVGFIILVFVFMIVIFVIIFKHIDVFTENPFIYGAKKMNLGECYCNCFNGINQQPISLKFNSTSLSYPNSIK